MFVENKRTDASYVNTCRGREPPVINRIKFWITLWFWFCQPEIINREKEYVLGCSREGPIVKIVLGSHQASSQNNPN